jgi:hypothetical protein
MLKYVGKVLLTPIAEVNLYELTASLSVVYVRRDGETKAVLVPEGYRTDGASIPRFLWEELGSPFSPEFMLPAIVHDWHCNQYDAGYNKISVDEMSDLFFSLLMHNGVSKFKSLTMEQAVRMYKSIF